MTLGDAGHQKPTKVGRDERTTGEARKPAPRGEAPPAAHGNGRSGTDHLMEKVVEGSNIRAALKRVKKNKGSPGIDGMTVEELGPWLVTEWSAVREQLLAGTYRPKPVREHEIEKSDGGVRKLGIPTVLDRLIQQAILQVLQPRFDPTFSPHSYGFRPGRSTQQAVAAAQRHMQAGYRVVVDVDLEKFFDRVNHDVLMGRLAKRIEDRTLLGLLRRFLEAGIMANGMVMEREEGTPQGGPLSPLLANVLLDEVDKELERRGHRFVRYADDCNVYVRSERAGRRVMDGLKRLYGQLKLRINEEKSTVGEPHRRSFLGYSLRITKNGVLFIISAKSIKRLKDRIRELTRRRGGRSMAAIFAELRRLLPGWRQHFRLVEVNKQLKDLDAWIRRRLRQMQLAQWRRGPRIYRQLLTLGVGHLRAAITASKAGAGRWWAASNTEGINYALSKRYFTDRGVPQVAV